MSETPSYALAAVIAPHPAAACAARDVLIEGGNAIEAAVAALAVVSVVLPQAGGAGGDGVWLVREAGSRGRTRVLDARGTVGTAATLRSFRDRDLDAIPAHGADAVLTLPGAVAGWRAALELAKALGGRLPIKRLLEPAIAAAREGFAAPDPALRPLPPDLAKAPGLADAFLVEGKLPSVGEIRRAPAWAETLAYLAEVGLDDFYRGDVGREITQGLRAIGAVLTREDLRHVEPRWCEPAALVSGLGLIETPPTRSARALMISLGLFERLPPSRPDSAAHRHGCIEAMKRAEALLDAADASEGDGSVLLGPAALQVQALEIDAKRAAPALIRAPATEDSAWIGVVDGQGVAVSLIQSIGTAFGSGCCLPKTGLLMGNRGAVFQLDDEEGRVLRRGRRAPLAALPLMASAPKAGVTSFAASTWPIAVAVAAQWCSGASLGEAIAAPRAWPEGSFLSMEEGVDPSILTALGRAGHEIRPLASRLAGEAGALRRIPAGRIEVAPDPRRDSGFAGF